MLEYIVGKVQTPVACLLTIDPGVPGGPSNPASPWKVTNTWTQVNDTLNFSDKQWPVSTSLFVCSIVTVGHSHQGRGAPLGQWPL